MKRVLRKLGCLVIAFTAFPFLLVGGCDMMARMGMFGVYVGGPALERFTIALPTR
jgi:hypothetical protein